MLPDGICSREKLRAEGFVNHYSIRFASLELTAAAQVRAHHMKIVCANRKPAHGWNDQPRSFQLATESRDAETPRRQGGGERDTVHSRERFQPCLQLFMKGDLVFIPP